MSDNGVTFAATVDYGDDPRWEERSLILSTLERGAGPWRQLAHFLTVLRGASERRVLVLNSSSGSLHPDLLTAALLGFRRRRPAVVLMGCMWDKDRGVRGFIQRILVRLADRGIDRYAVQSSAELRLFPATWNVSPNKPRFVPYFATITDSDLHEVSSATQGLVFAGGDSHRDYEPLVAAAHELPDTRFILATRALSGRRELPRNIEAGPVSHERFMDALQHSSVVAVPLRSGIRRAAGQQTYLNAMWLGKPTIVTSSPGVDDYVNAGRTAVVVSGSAESYIQALRWALDPANAHEVAELGRAAAREVRARFSFSDHVTALLEVIDDAAACGTS